MYLSAVGDGVEQETTLMEKNHTNISTRSLCPWAISPVWFQLLRFGSSAVLRFTTVSATTTNSRALASLAVLSFLSEPLTALRHSDGAIAALRGGNVVEILINWLKSSFHSQPLSQHSHAVVHHCKVTDHTRSSVSSEVFLCLFCFFCFFYFFLSWELKGPYSVFFLYFMCSTYKVYVVTKQLHSSSTFPPSILSLSLECQRGK